MAIFTSVLVIVSAGQGCFLYQANELARTTAIKQLRAYVTVFPPIAERSRTGELTVTVEIKNTGATLANDVIINSVLIQTDFPYAGPFDFSSLDPKRHVSKFVSGPNSAFQHSKAIVIENATLEGIPKGAPRGTKAVWFYGEVRYRDAFDGIRSTKFRFISGGNATDQITNMIFASEGNEAN